MIDATCHWAHFSPTTCRSAFYVKDEGKWIIFVFSANLQGKYGYVCVILTNYVALKCNKTYEIYCIILLTIKNNAITTKLIAIDICKKAIMNFVYSRKKFFDRKTGRVHKKTRRLLTLYEFWMPFGKLEIYWTQC